MASFARGAGGAPARAYNLNMRISVLPKQLQATPADVLIVNLFEGVTTPGGAAGAVDTALGSVDGVPGKGAISRLIELGDFRGKLNELAVIYTHGLIPAPRVIIVGLGKAADLTAERVRQASGTAVRKAAALGCKNVATVTHGSGSGGMEARAASQATVEGAILGAYQHLEQKSRPESREIDTLVVLEADHGRFPAVRDGARDGEIIANAQNTARTLVNRPPNVMYPEAFADHCAAMARKRGLKITVLTEKEMEALRMGGVLSVNKGSANPPRFVILEHAPRGTAKQAPLVLIGKGVCFDTGGYSIKTADGMVTMKGDMSGAAAVAGAMQAIAELKLPRRVIGLMPLVENRISNEAFLPSDVLTMMNGMTVEIISTDAEGRLILADALHYAKRFNPAGVVDIATLTGVASMAMGDCMAATAHTTDEVWGRAVTAAGNGVGERLWPMPLWPEYGEGMKSDTADFKNSAGNRSSGLGASGWFLQQFTLDDKNGPAYPWAHIDMAPMMFSKNTAGYLPKGSLGFGVRTFVALAQTV